jgi:hypothetical protein
MMKLSSVKKVVIDTVPLFLALESWKFTLLASNAALILEPSLLKLPKDEFRDSLQLNVLSASGKDAASTIASLNTHCELTLTYKGC